MCILSNKTQTCPGSLQTDVMRTRQELLHDVKRSKIALNTAKNADWLSDYWPSPLSLTTVNTGHQNFVTQKTIELL